MWQVERTPAEHVNSALALLVTGGRADMDSAIGLREIRSYLASLAAKSSTVWWARQGKNAVASVVVIHTPGKAAIMLHSTTAAGIIPVDALADVAAAAAQEALAEGATLVQVLLDPQAEDDITAFKQVNFSLLAELIYMHLHLRGRVIPPPPRDLEFVSYSSATHGDFAAAIAASYVSSLDCPGLEGLRNIEDVITGHKASGVFRPELWTLAKWQGQPAGVILLNENVQAAALEVVYMGVASPFRGKGVGLALLNRAGRWRSAKNLAPCAWPWIRATLMRGGCMKTRALPKRFASWPTCKKGP